MVVRYHQTIAPSSATVIDAASHHKRGILIIPLTGVRLVKPYRYFTVVVVIDRSTTVKK